MVIVTLATLSCRIDLVKCLIVRLAARVATTTTILLTQVGRGIAARVRNGHHGTIQARADDTTLNLILLVLL